MPKADIHPDPDMRDRIRIETNYVDRFLIKQLPGARYESESQTWHAPLSWASCVIMRGLFKAELEIGQDLGTWAWRERRERVEEANRLRDKLQIDDDDDSPAAKTIRGWRGTWPNGRELYPFQEAGIRYFYAAVSAGLTDPMGSGKTLQGVLILRLLHELGESPLPALVVCPNSVKDVWVKHIRDWFPEARGQLVHGSAGERVKQLQSSSDVYVINWESLRLHSRLEGYGSYALRGCRVCDDSMTAAFNHATTRQLQAQRAVDEPPDGITDDEYEALKTTLGEANALLRAVKRDTNPSSCEKCPRELNAIAWRTVIADEAHRAKDPRSKQTRALWAVSRPAVRRYFMTGTPIESEFEDMWAPLHFMDPREWPTKSRTMEYFTNQVFNFWGGTETLGLKPETRAQLFAILDPRIRRMPKEIILPQLPPKTYTERPSPLTPKQAKAYAAMVKELLAEVGDGDIKASLTGANPLTKNVRLMQLAAGYLVPGESDGEFRLAEPSGKLDVLDEIIEEMAGEPLAVFARHRQLIDLAIARLERRKGRDRLEYRVITGAVSVPDRNQAVEDFQSGRAPIMLATMAAGGTGITLTRANTLVRLQRDWSTITNQQTEDRVHRIGSEVHDAVNIIDVVSPGTIETHQLDVLSDKAGQIEEVVRDKQALERLLLGESGGTR